MPWALYSWGRGTAPRKRTGRAAQVSKYPTPKRRKQR